MTKAKRILLVEDSRTQALRIQLTLKQHNLQVEIAGTGKDGLEAARKSPPDAIVLDIQLPDMDGYTICRDLKSDPETTSIPIVMLTQHDEAESTLVGLEAGAQDYIPKDSFAEQNLVESLRSLGIIKSE